jgi:hydantoinase/carbamoylase family amidase
MGDAPAIDAARVIADLRELARRTGDAGGAQRVAWTETWRDARDFLGELLAELDLEPERDAAGNLWATLRGADPDAPALAVGSHVDSVPDGGWLDGALGVMAALGALRAWATAGSPPHRSLCLVDWADEEGARFGRSLLGSSAFSGTLDTAEVAALRDAEGVTLAEALAENGIELERAPEAGARAATLGAYLELHIEQGPVLEAEGLAVAAVRGCAGVERKRIRFAGQAAHAGTTPMGARSDAGLAAAETALAVERIAFERGGVGTIGGLALEPGIPTAVPGRAELLVDLRHPDAAELEAMLGEVRAAAAAHAAERGCSCEEEPIWRIEPIPFDDRLVELATEAAVAAGGRTDPLTSGALHDAAEAARVVPAAMMFCPSRAGLSHTVEEDTAEADLATAIEAYGELVDRLLSEVG